jgi:acyl-CoA thioester hydrolase
MSEFGFTEEIGLRMNDFDANQHVNNTAFVSFLQDARANYFRELWGEDWTESSVVIATLDVDFLAPIVMGDTVHVDVRVVDVGTSSWTVEYRVRAVPEEGADLPERVAAEASSVQVAWDREAESSQPLPESWRDELEAELVTPEA